MYFHTYLSTFILTYILSYLLTYFHTYLHPFIHTYILSYLLTYFRTYLHTFTEFLLDKETARELRITEAKERNELQECSCCYDTEVLFEDMLTCPEGHLFCRDCIRQSAEVVIGEGKTHFACLGDGVRYILVTLSVCCRSLINQSIKQYIKFFFPCLHGLDG